MNLHTLAAKSRGVRAFNIRVSYSSSRPIPAASLTEALEPDAKLKDYDQARAGTHALLQDVMPKADPPELVADVVLRAATDRRPRRRYTAGKIARQISLLRRFAPAQMFDKKFCASNCVCPFEKRRGPASCSWQLFALSDMT